MEGRKEVNAFATGERQGLQERSDEGPRARTAQNRQGRRDTACKVPHSGLRNAGGLRVAGASW